MKSLVLPMAVVACVLAGCADPQPGEARPANTVGITTSTGSPTRVAPSRSDASTPLSGVQPCDLLSDTDRRHLQLDPGRPNTFGRTKVCDWQTDGWGVTIGLKVDLAFRDADLRGATPKQVNIGRHEAYEVRNAGGSRGACEIFVITGQSSFVQITVTKRVDTDGACARVSAIARLADPKLP